MEINKYISEFKKFTMTTVRYNEVEYLRISSANQNLFDLLDLPIKEFEEKYERELLHTKLQLVFFYNSITKALSDNLTKFDNSEISLDDVKKLFYVDILSFKEQFHWEIEYLTKNFGQITFYFINDFLNELEGKISDIVTLLEYIKPYHLYQDIPLNDFLITDVQLLELDGFPYSDWTKISLTAIDITDLVESNIITFYQRIDDKNSVSALKKTTFNEAIKPKAINDFKKWYERFCIDDPETDKLDVILFFKLMNIQGYFIKELSIEQLHQITIDHTKRNISFNYFKNNGRKKFEDWLDGKPIVNKFS